MICQFFFPSETRTHQLPKLDPSLCGICKAPNIIVDYSRGQPTLVTSDSVIEHRHQLNFMDDVAETRCRTRRTRHQSRLAPAWVINTCNKPSVLPRFVAFINVFGVRRHRQLFVNSEDLPPHPIWLPPISADPIGVRVLMSVDGVRLDN